MPDTYYQPDNKSNVIRVIRVIREAWAYGIDVHVIARSLGREAKGGD